MRLPLLAPAVLAVALSLVSGCGNASDDPRTSASDGTTLPSGKPVGTPLPTGDFCARIPLGEVAAALQADAASVGPAEYLADGSTVAGSATKVVGNSCLFDLGARGTVEVTVFERQGDAAAATARTNVEGLGCTVADAPAYGDPGFLADCSRQRAVIAYGLNGSASFGCKVNFVPGSGAATARRGRADSFCRTALTAITS